MVGRRIELREGASITLRADGKVVDSTRTGGKVVSSARAGGKLVSSSRKQREGTSSGWLVQFARSPTRKKEQNDSNRRLL